MNGNYEFLSITAAIRIFLEKLAVTFVIGLGVVYILFQNSNLKDRTTAENKSLDLVTAQVAATSGATGGNSLIRQ